MIDERQRLESFRKVFLFLHEIPEKLYFGLSTKEFYFPSLKIRRIADELAFLLNQHVMTYNAHVFDLSLPLEKHLCATIESATLSRKQYLLVKSYEERVKEMKVSFVVYKNPITVANREQTALYRYYRERNLL